MRRARAQKREAGQRTSAKLGYDGQSARTQGQSTTTLTTVNYTPWVRLGPFRFLDLPAELRVNVYRYLLPHGVEICPHESSIMWRAVKKTVDMDAIGKLDELGIPNIFNWHRGGFTCCRATSLFLVNQSVSSEARSILYGSNHFFLNFDGKPHHPVSLQSPNVFGLFGQPYRLSLLRDLRSICITIGPTIHDSLYWGNRRHRGRLSLFVRILKEHAEDENQKSLLKVLNVYMASPRLPDSPVAPAPVPLAPPQLFVAFFAHPPHQSIKPAPPAPNFTSEGRQHLAEVAEMAQFALEALAPLRGIEVVEITGVDAWFAQCLHLCIQGKGGDVRKIQYPDVLVKRRKAGTRTLQDHIQSTKKWYMHELDWEEFAERNGIKVPVDIDYFLGGKVRRGNGG